MGRHRITLSGQRENLRSADFSLYPFFLVAERPSLTRQQEILLILALSLERGTPNAQHDDMSEELRALVRETDVQFIEWDSVTAENEADCWVVRAWAGDEAEYVADPVVTYTVFGPFPDGLSASVWADRFLNEMRAAPPKALVDGDGNVLAEAPMHNARVEPVFTPGDFD